MGFGTAFDRGLNIFQDSVVQGLRSRGFVRIFDGGIDTGRAIGPYVLRAQILAKDVLKRFILALLTGIDPFFSKFLHVMTLNLCQSGRYYGI